MKYRWNAVATEPYGSGKSLMRALICLYYLFCSSVPVTCSIHFAAMSIASVAELFEPFRQEAPGPPEFFQIVASMFI